jgi:hypothetical protein
MKYTMDFDDKLRDIIESRFTYENVKDDSCSDLTNPELTDLCILYAYENKNNERFADGLTIDNCGNINDLVRSIAALCLEPTEDDLLTAIDNVKDIASKSFVKAYSYEVEKIFENKLIQARQDRNCSREEWDDTYLDQAKEEMVGDVNINEIGDDNVR